MLPLLADMFHHGFQRKRWIQLIPSERRAALRTKTRWLFADSLLSPISPSPRPLVRAPNAGGQVLVYARVAERVPAWRDQGIDEH
jgi:hypothetical protein